MIGARQIDQGPLAAMELSKCLHRSHSRVLPVSHGRHMWMGQGYLCTSHVKWVAFLQDLGALNFMKGQFSCQQVMELADQVQICTNKLCCWFQLLCFYDLKCAWLYTFAPENTYEPRLPWKSKSGDRMQWKVDNYCLVERGLYPCICKIMFLNFCE